jgi:dolichol-phosphate mannosyltransferase
MKDSISLVIPTYNESENIENLLRILCEIYEKNNYEGEIIVVDDDSPDGTWKKVETFQQLHRPFVRLLRRFNKRGLSSAVVDGFAMAEGTVLGVMDADLSHPPGKIPELLAPIFAGRADLVIGSRYTGGGGTANWPIKRKLISKAASIVLRPLVKVKDPLSGFFFFRKEVIRGARLNPIGFKIGMEIIAKGKYKHVMEIPITFQGRKFGKSKLTPGQVKEFLLQLFYLLRWKKRG